ncbi:ER lumen protein retaining receptor [Platanthera zijinensis]|uniref:ER lumen protein retaining receptor n=1 Tax=Platanthera zijinensis TaxID=2320716 RepID=A0AAP0G8X0_9ASPA
MPFGLTNAPSTFQALMNSLFQPYLRKFIVIFFDDILIFSPTEATHLENLRTTLGYDFLIKYKAGKTNQAADTLSRITEIPDDPTIARLNILSSPLSPLLEGLEREYAADAMAQQIKQDPQAFPNWTLHHNYIMHHNRIYIPENSVIKARIIKEAHSSLLVGHSGIRDTLHRIQPQFFWRHMKKEITKFVNQCDVCQKAKSSNHLPYGLLQPLPTPSRLWADITMDFNTHLPKSKGHTIIFVAVDRFSKAAHFTPLKHPISGPLVANAFWGSVGKLHGLLESIISDRDTIFLSDFWVELFRLQGTHLKYSSSYHPQTDGLTERINRCLEQYLRIFSHEHPNNWSEYLNSAEYHYDTSYNSSTNMTPFEVMYGRPPPSLLPYTAGTTSNEAVDATLQTREELLHCLKQNLHKAQQRMKAQADRKRKELKLDKGDWVLLKLHPYRQLTMSRPRGRKLNLKYYGPFQVLDTIGATAYKLLLPPESRIHPVFHASMIKPYIGDPRAQIVNLPPDQWKNNPLHQPLAIINTQNILRKGQPVSQALVQWEGHAPADSTWEDISSLEEPALTPAENRSRNILGSTSTSPPGQRSSKGNHGSSSESKIHCIKFHGDRHNHVPNAQTKLTILYHRPHNHGEETYPATLGPRREHRVAAIPPGGALFLRWARLPSLTFPPRLQKTQRQTLPTARLQQPSCAFHQNSTTSQKQKETTLGTASLGRKVMLGSQSGLTLWPQMGQQHQKVTDVTAQHIEIKVPVISTFQEPQAYRGLYLFNWVYRFFTESHRVRWILRHLRCLLFTPCGLLAIRGFLSVCLGARSDSLTRRGLPFLPAAVCLSYPPRSASLTCGLTRCGLPFLTVFASLTRGLNHRGLPFLTAVLCYSYPPRLLRLPSSLTSLLLERTDLAIRAVTVAAFFYSRTSSWPLFLVAASARCGLLSTRCELLYDLPLFLPLSNRCRLILSAVSRGLLLPQTIFFYSSRTVVLFVSCLIRCQPLLYPLPVLPCYPRASSLNRCRPNFAVRQTAA